LKLNFKRNDYKRPLADKTVRAFFTPLFRGRFGKIKKKGNLYKPLFVILSAAKNLCFAV